MKPKIFLQNGVPGSGKTSGLMSTIKKRAQVHASSRFQTGIYPIKVVVLTFANINSEKTKESYLRNIDRMSKFDCFFCTIDSFILQYLPLGSEIDYSNEFNITMKAWTDYLESGTPLAKIREKTAEWHLYNIFEGRIQLSSSDCVEMVFVDEAQDLQPRHIIALLILLAGSFIEELHFWGDKQQSLFNKNVDVGLSPSKAMAQHAMLESLFHLVVKKIRAPIKEVFIEEAPVNMITTRLSKEYIKSLESSAFDTNRRIFLGPDYRVSSRISNYENRYIETPIKSLQKAADIRTVQIDRNLLKSNPGDIERYFANFIFEISESIGIPILCFYHEEVINSLKNSFFSRESDEYLLTIRDHFSGAPQSKEGLFLSWQMLEKPNVSEAFLQFLRLYLYRLSEAIKEPFQRKLILGFDLWIKKLEELPEETLSETLKRAGLSDILSWFSLLEMHKDQELMQSLLPNERFLTPWTVYKAKGQTFLESTAVPCVPRSIKKWENPNIAQCKLYTALSRSKARTYFIYRE